MTGSRSSRGCAMKLSNGKVVSEEKEIKKRWYQYTENLYRRDINMIIILMYIYMKMNLMY